MPGSENPMSPIKFYGIMLAFLLVGLVGIYFPVSSSLHLLEAISSHSDKIAFEKGAYYLFGGGLILTIIPIWAVYALVSNQKHNEKFFRVMVTFLGVCFISIFILPRIMSSSIGDYLENRGYTYCDKQSRQWLLNRTLVYTKKVCN